MALERQQRLWQHQYQQQLTQAWCAGADCVQAALQDALLDLG
jgi:hypothetical protein